MEFGLDKYMDVMEKKGPRTMKQPEDRDDNTVEQRSGLIMGGEDKNQTAASE